MIIDILLGQPEGRGGLEDVITLVTQELTTRGHQVRILLSGHPKYSDWVKSLPEVYFYDPITHGNPPNYDGEIDFFRYILGYRDFIENNGVPNVILATHVPLFCLVARVATSYLIEKRPTIISWMHASLHMFNGTEVLLNYCDAHLALTQSMAIAIQNSLGSNALVFPIGNPIDIKNITLISRPQRGTEFLYIGRIDNKQKRIDVLFKSLQHIQGHWHLTIIGDGPDMIELKKYAAALGIAGRVYWKGWREKPWDSIKSASALILPSQNEPFGIVLLEALARGIPVIASRCEGPADIVQEGINGWLFDVGNTEQLSVILQEFVDQKLTLPSEEICRESVERFQLETVVEKLEVIIIHLIPNKHNHVPYS